MSEVGRGQEREREREREREMRGRGGKERIVYAVRRRGKERCSIEEPIHCMLHIHVHVDG